MRLASTLVALVVLPLAPASCARKAAPAAEPQPSPPASTSARAGERASDSSAPSQSQSPGSAGFPEAAPKPDGDPLTRRLEQTDAYVGEKIDVAIESLALALGPELPKGFDALFEVPDDWKLHASRATPEGFIVDATLPAGELDDALDGWRKEATARGWNVDGGSRTGGVYVLRLSRADATSTLVFSERPGGEALQLNLTYSKRR